MHGIVILALGIFGGRQGQARDLDDRGLLFIGVLSSPTNVARRDAIRDTWGHSLPTNVSYMFFIGHAQGGGEDVYQEAVRHGDIHFVREKEGYTNITYKTMEIVSTYSARYIMKCDDDTYVRVGHILARLNEGTPEHWLWGYVSKGVPVQRSGKYNMVRSQWAPSTYPPFAHGPGYVLSAPLALWMDAHPLPHYIQLEDVAVGIWVSRAKKAGVDVAIEHGNFPPHGCKNNANILHYATPEKMREYHVRWGC